MIESCLKMAKQGFTAERQFGDRLAFKYRVAQATSSREADSKRLKGSSHNS